MSNQYIRNKGVNVNYNLIKTPGYKLQIGDLLHFENPNE
jgi:RNA-binding protein YlmH